MFPVPLKEATLMSLSNDATFHFEPLSKTETERKLKEDGEYLIQNSEDGDSMLLSVKKDRVHEFPITIMESSSMVTFNIGHAEFHSYDSLVNYVKNNGIKNADEEIVNFRKAVASSTGRHGRFGAEFKRALRPRCPVQVRFDMGVPNPSCRLVALRKEVSSSEDELEELIKLRHSNVVSLLDFAVYGRQLKNRLMILRYEHHEDNFHSSLYGRGAVPLATTCKWIKQAAEAMFYLNEANAYNTIACAQECFLDATGNLKIGGQWIGTWPTLMEDTVKHRFYWRFCDPNFLLFQKMSSPTLMFNWSVFAWQIATRCQLLPFSQFPNAYEFLRERERAIELPLPSTPTIDPLYNGLVSIFTVFFQQIQGNQDDCRLVQSSVRLHEPTYQKCQQPAVRRKMHMELSAQYLQIRISCPIADSSGQEVASIRVAGSIFLIFVHCIYFFGPICIVYFFY